MSERHVKLFLTDIPVSIDRIGRYTAGISFENFENSEMIIDAVVRNLEIIGEASRQIPQEMRDRHPTINWKAVVGFRNIAIHAYFNVDLEIVWTIVTRQISELKTVVGKMISLEQ